MSNTEYTDNEDDSPLDFSQKKSKVDRRESSVTEPESPCSRLRDILSMKSPALPDDFAASVLNLSKESPISNWLKSESRSSTSGSPVMDLNPHQSFIANNPVSPRGSSAASLSASTPISSITNNNNSGLPHMVFSPYGAFSPTISPVLNQNLPGSGISLGNFEADTSSSLFSPHLVGSANMGALPYLNGLPLQIINNGAGSGQTKGRATRPFKAYPKDPLRFPSVGMYGLPLGLSDPSGTAEAMIHQQSHQVYTEFRKRMLAQSQTSSKSRRPGQRGSDNSMCPNMSLNYRSSIDVGAGSSAEENEVAEEELGKNLSGKTEQQLKDEAYWERRRKNNEAAKRSRDARRAKEDEIAIRAAFLEQENGKLRYEVSLLRTETNRLRCELYNGNA